MSTFIDRLAVEIEELQEKTNKLGSFLESEAFEDLSRIEQDLLSAQYPIMVSYLQILTLRFHIAVKQVIPQNPENIN
jgi:hypothetical protein